MSVSKSSFGLYKKFAVFKGGDGGGGPGVEPLFFHVNTLPLCPPSLLYSLTQTPTAEATMLIWTNFDNFAITYLMEVACFKFHFPIKVVLNSLQTQKGLEPDFRFQFSQKFLMRFFFYNVT